MVWIGLLGRACAVGRSGGWLLMLLVVLCSAHAHAASAGDLRLYGGDDGISGSAPLLTSDVSIEVSGMLARVRVAQRFRNPGTDWVEGVYVFPLPDEAAVDRLSLHYAGRRIEGEIRPRRQAREDYVRARAAGQRASLLDQQRANLFTVAVANIPPGETVAITIAYQQTVRWVDGTFSLRFPMVVAPRYIPGRRSDPTVPGETPGWAAATDQVPDAPRITPPVALDADDSLNPLSLQARIDAGLTLAEITSPYHAIRTQRHADGHYLVQLAAGQVPAERDFVLRWRPAATDYPSGAMFTETWRGQHYAMLMVMPPHAATAVATRARELILVVDTSGSMHGDSMEQSRRALLSAVHRLQPGDRFNVIQFDDRVDALYGQAVPVTPRRLQQARRYIAGLRADGGTEMLPAVRRALTGSTPGGRLRQVVLITDGAIGNEQALFELIADRIGDSRLFTVGIGAAPNALFMRQAARAGRGSFTYIGHSAAVETEIGALFRRLSAPVLTDIRLRWEGGPGDAARQQTPSPVPDLYHGEPLVVAVRSTGAARAVTIEGRFGDRWWRRRVTLRHAGDSPGLHALWARRRIDDWLTQRLSGADPARVRKAVERLALEHRLVSRYTSLVAVDKTPARPDGAALRAAAVPVRLPAGWSAEAVFGRLPGTATAAPLALVAGLLGLLVSGWLFRRRA